jgi:hypothetical protein
MKTKSVIIILLLTGFGIRLMAGGENISYVKTENKVYFGEDIKMGLFNTKVFSPDGSIALVHNRDIVAYMHDSKLFELMPLMGGSNETLGYAMMEYVTSRSGLRLYRYSSKDQKTPQYTYYVYKNGKLHLCINQENAASTLPFFGIKVL